MSPETKNSLELFAYQVKWETLAHPDDMERFWDFVIIAYRRGDHAIPFEDFLTTVRETKMISEIDTQKKKKRLAFKLFMFNKYEEGIQLLNKLEKFR